MTDERIDNPMARNDGVFGGLDPEHECPACGVRFDEERGCSECSMSPDCDEDGDDGNDRDNVKGY